MVVRSYFSQTHDRPAFRAANKISHDKEDHELLLTVRKKPPISSKN
jgi:hypothetical protein